MASFVQVTKECTTDYSNQSLAGKRLERLKTAQMIVLGSTIPDKGDQERDQVDVPEEELRLYTLVVI